MCILHQSQGTNEEHNPHGWNEIVDQVESVQNTQEKRGIDDNTFKEKCIQTMCKLQDLLHKSEDMGRLLQEDMGVAAKELDGMTVWEAIEKLVHDTTNLTKTWDETKRQFVDTSTVNALRDEVQKCKNFIIQMKGSFNILQAESGQCKQIEHNLINFKEHYMKFYAQVQQVFLNQGPSNNTSGPPNVGFKFNPPGATVNSTQTPADGNGTVATIEAALASIKVELSDLQASLHNERCTVNLDTISARVKELESRVSGDSCSINHGEFIFTSVTDVASWLDKEDVPTMGIFWDVFSVLVAMALKRLTGKERADQQYSSDRINTTTAENELAASMAYKRPQTL